MKPEVKDFVVQRLATISAHALSADAKEILRAANEAFVALALDRVWGAAQASGDSGACSGCGKPSGVVGPAPGVAVYCSDCGRTQRIRRGRVGAVSPGLVPTVNGEPVEPGTEVGPDDAIGVAPMPTMVYAKDDDNGSSELWAKMPDGSTRRVDISPTTNLIGGPGWQKGVLDCIDVLFVRQINGQADFNDAIKQLQSLFARDAVPKAGDGEG